ncbi:MAG: IS200/IS605 family transposase [Ignavibacteria bacterium]|nr:IS200/IS605 family transposase [Ignavibacteria bacterium]
MPFVKVYVHFVFSTKDRKPFLSDEGLREKVWSHIKEYSRENGIFLDLVNGYSDHCHCLISLGIEQSMSKIMNLLKGESSHWINKNNLCAGKFEWQDEYCAVSVSESIVERVRKYIKHQEYHHHKKSFKEEYDELIRKFGFKEFG